MSRDHWRIAAIGLLVLLPFAFAIGRVTAPQPVPVLRPAPVVAGSGEANVLPSDPHDHEAVYVTRTGAKYHRAGCSYLRTSGTPTTRAVAVAKGLGPCSRCKP